MINSNSPTHEKLQALIACQTEITALNQVFEVGLGSVNISLAKQEISNHAAQLEKMITGE